MDRSNTEEGVRQIVQVVDIVSLSKAVAIRKASKKAGTPLSRLPANGHDVKERSSAKIHADRLEPINGHSIKLR